MTAPAPAPGGAAHPGHQEGHPDGVSGDAPPGTRRPVQHAPTAPPSLRDGRVEAALRALELTVRGRLDLSLIHI